jgi:PPK2 family polyphosphate:nucleotide phosphotransferase
MTLNNFGGDDNHEPGTDMRIKSGAFRIGAGAKVNLDRVPTDIARLYKSKAEYENLLDTRVDQLRSLQEAHYASDSYALLLIFQAMDAAGKDGAITHVMSGVNPQGCQVFSFKHPSAIELDHDFLWRASLCLPERGRIGIFNRSYYEEVLIVRVHPNILSGQRLPDGLADDHTVWKGRYRSIVDFEDHLYRNGTRIVKFFLHISPEEQQRRLLQRIDNPKKNWKMRAEDLDERGYWKDYMRAYEQCIQATSTRRAPWYVVPADDKRNARLIVSQIVVDALKAIKPELPRITPARRRELQTMRKRLTKS